MGKFIVMVRSAKMPASVKAPYKNIAVVETDGSGVEPKMLSPRAKHVVRIVKMWPAQHLGRDPKGNTAAEVAQREAEAIAARLNVTQAEEAA